jgi:large subunit ribosomal protein L5
MNRLQQTYQTKLKSELQKSLELGNVHQIPQIEKIVVNAGVGRAVADSKYLDTAVEMLTKITGQKPVVTKARHSIATFKLREGMPIGAKVTLRGEKMWNFLDRFISIVIPRMRDFRGLSIKSFDPQGNYSIGINDQTVFPELNFEDSSSTGGLQITIITSARTPEQSEALLRGLGLPLEKGTK